MSGVLTFVALGIECWSMWKLGMFCKLCGWIVLFPGKWPTRAYETPGIGRNTRNTGRPGRTRWPADLIWPGGYCGSSGRKTQNTIHEINAYTRGGHVYKRVAYTREVSVYKRLLAKKRTNVGQWEGGEHIRKHVPSICV